jgi:hypothetical protein
VLFAFAWLGWRAWSTWMPLPPPTTHGPDIVTNTEFPARRFTAADVQRIASGEDRSDLLEGVAEGGDWRHSPEAAHVEITAGFGPPSGTLTDFRRVGWPIPWITHRYDASYSDVYARTDPTPSSWRHPVGWSGWLPRRSHFEHSIDHGRRHIRIFSPENLVGLALLAMAGMEIGRVVRRATRSGSRLRRLLPVAGLLLPIAVAALLMHEREQTTMRHPRPWMPETHRTGLRYSDVRTSADNQRLAAEILRVTPGKQDGVLIIGSHIGFQMTQTHSNRGCLGINRTRVGYPALDPSPRVEPVLESSWLAVSVRGSGPLGGHVTHFSISTVTVCEFLLAVYALWKAPLLVRALHAAWFRRRARWRLLTQRCPRCGYSLA